MLHMVVGVVVMMVRAIGVIGSAVVGTIRVIRRVGV